MIYPEMVEVQVCPKERRQNQGGKATGGKHQSEAVRRVQDLRGPVEVQAIMFEALRGQKLDFKSPGGLGTGYKVQGAELQEQEAQVARPRRSIMGKGLGCKATGVK
jgi:hypothetical protein